MAETRSPPPRGQPRTPRRRRRRSSGRGARRRQRCPAKSAPHCALPSTTRRRRCLAAHPAEATASPAAAARGGAEGAGGGGAAEVEDDAATLGRGVARLAARCCGARHAVVYTGRREHVGADPRLPRAAGDLDAAQARRAQRGSAARAQLMAMPFEDARPTAAHLALAELHRRGHIAAVVSQNIDGLHLRSGVPAAALCELHGNVFRERCAACGAEPLRGFDVTARSAYHRHGTGRACGCGAPLADRSSTLARRCTARRSRARRRRPPPPTCASSSARA